MITIVLASSLMSQEVFSYTNQLYHLTLILDNLKYAYLVYIISVTFSPFSYKLEDRYNHYQFVF